MEGIRVLFSEEDLKKRCSELGREITSFYEGRELLLVGVLKGVFPFFADLARQIKLPCKCDFLGLSSYGSQTETSGVVRVTHDLSLPVQGQDVLVIEDIVDTGLTMQHLLKSLRLRNPNSVAICTLLCNPTRMRVEVPLHYVGFEVTEFVVGYGLDDQEYLRNLPFIGVKDGTAR